MSSDIVTQDHGSGGKLTRNLIQMFSKHFGNSGEESMTDSAVFDTDTGISAFTTDSYVVKPIQFPGGNIGKLAVCGTVNDLAVSGAIPRYLSCSFILEEGLKIIDLEEIVISMANTAKEAEIRIVTGDTKVVERGACDRIYINTAGVGFLKKEHRYIGTARDVKEGDKILINGNIGDHGLAVLSIRNSFKNDIKSDCAPLNDLIQSCLLVNDSIHFMRDATRGGLAAVLTELAEKVNLGISLDENTIPMAENTRGLCEFLGFDPLHLANEGKVIMVAGKGWEDILETMKSHPLGKKSRVIGTVIKRHPGRLVLHTEIGGSRIIDIPAGMQLPEDMLMHELTVISNIFKIILETAEKNNLSKISKIRLKVGRQRHLAPDLMKFAFETVSINTIAADATLEIERVDIQMRCRSCGLKFTVTDNTYLCIACESADLETITGKDLLIENIEGEV